MLVRDFVRISATSRPLLFLAAVFFVVFLAVELFEAEVFLDEEAFFEEEEDFEAAKKILEQQEK